MKRASEDKLVSIIVPVYNVKEYLDVCLESIVNQSYKNIEIIVINDGSTDGSEEKCLEWEKRDKRITYISKRNEGLGPTRNYGIGMAQGEYVAFVDSDDWLDTTFVEKMYNAIVATGADMAVCDFYRIDVDAGLKTYHINNAVMGKDFSKAERIIWGSPVVWTMITKKSLWVQNNIKMPALSSEDIAVCALLIALNEKICSVKEPLYYYRQNRPGSITFNKEAFTKVPLAMACLLDNFKTRNMFEQYQSILYRQMLNLMSRSLITCLTKMDKLEYKDCEKKYIEFLAQEFSYRTRNVIVLGSYNLTRIVNKLPVLENPYNRFQFMSLASVMSAKKMLEPPNHKNPYRKHMLNREFDGSFFEILDEERPEYIIIDFIEERHALLELEGSYYTKSDALQESDFDVEKGRSISRYSEECKRVWENACICFIEEVKKRFKAKNVILVENYLAEQYGVIEKQSEYENLVEIRKINNTLKNYYNFFTENYTGIQKIEAFKESLYFTDEKYRYGCYPWHLNELVNVDIANKIRIDTDGQSLGE